MRHASPRRRVLPAMLATIVALAVAATGCATATNTQNPERETMKATHVPEYGKVLVDREGRSVYLFAKDPRNESTCYGACLSVWPPVRTDGMPKAKHGAKRRKLSTFRRDDGTTQVAYAGHPLYYYQADTTPGDTTGQDIDQFGAEWYLLSPRGKIVAHDSGKGS